MKFQLGQSGNPAGRPLGARNKKTIAQQQVFAATQDETAKMIVARAQCGNPTAMRICAERTPPELELPPIRCAADAQKALDMVIEAFARGAITVREFPCLLGAVDRMTRVAERIEAMSERERERYKAQRVHGVHPDMIPKPTGEPDRVVEAMRAAGEDVPEYLAAAHDRGHARLYSPVNFAADAEEGPVEAASDAVAEAAEVSGFPSPRTKCGREGSGVGGDARSEQQIESPPDAGDAASPYAASEGGEGDGLYFSVNSAPSAGEDEPSASAAEKSSDLYRPPYEAPPTPDPSPPFAARMGGGEPRGLDLNPG